jgi:nitrite reductase/ring-hydroxylating ferredoxin subunit
MNDHEHAPEPRSACGHGVDRREFLRRATIIAGGVFAAMVDAGLARADDRWTVGEAAPLPGPAGVPLRRFSIPSADGAQVDAANELLIVRWRGQLFAFALACPHRGARLEWQTGTGSVHCPKHKARFRADGSHAGGRATRDLDRHPVRRVGDQLEVDIGTRLRADQDSAAWATAVVAVTA